MKNAKLKPLYLLDIFMEMTDERHPMSVPELTQELVMRGVNAERKGVYRDIDALRQYGAEIVHASNGYYIAAREFDAVELRMLVSAVRAAPFISRAREEELIKKLAALAGRHKAAGLAALPLWSEKCSDDTPFRLMEILGACIMEAKQATFLYAGESDDRRDTRRYRVNPYALFFDGGAAILAANAEGEEGIREFSLARMNGARMEVQARRHSGEVSAFKTGLSAQEYLRVRKGSGG